MSYSEELVKGLAGELSRHAKIWGSDMVVDQLLHRFQEESNALGIHLEQDAAEADDALDETIKISNATHVLLEIEAGYKTWLSKGLSTCDWQVEGPCRAVSIIKVGGSTKKRFLGEQKVDRYVAVVEIDHVAIGVFENFLPVKITESLFEPVSMNDYLRLAIVSIMYYQHDF